MTAKPKKGELITDGLYIKHVANGQILVCTIENMPRAVVDAWIEHCDQEMQTCLAENRPALFLQDLSNSSITQTPYSKKLGQKLTDSYPELVGRTAFVLPNTPDNLRLSIFVRRQPHQYRIRQVFFTYEEALAWLMEALDD